MGVTPLGLAACRLIGDGATIGAAGLTRVHPQTPVSRFLSRVVGVEGHTVCMTSIALFHSVLGVRPGISEAADRLRAEGHDVIVVDQYEGRVFDDYVAAGDFVELIGFPRLMEIAEEAVSGMPDGFIAAGFSSGGGMAEFVATRRPVSGVLMLSGALDLAMIGVEAWPNAVPAQIHYTVDDPFRDQGDIDAVAAMAKNGRSVYGDLRLSRRRAPVHRPLTPQRVRRAGRRVALVARSPVLRVSPALT